MGERPFRFQFHFVATQLLSAVVVGVHLYFFVLVGPFFFGQWSPNTLDSWPTTCKGPPNGEQHQRASVTDVAAP